MKEKDCGKVSIVVQLCNVLGKDLWKVPGLESGTRKVERIKLLVK